MIDEIRLRTGERIPLSALEFATSRSGGPGGQNVNKVETRVEARLQILGSQWIRPETQERLLLKLGSKASADGVVRLVSNTERTQLGNKEAVVERMVRLLNLALTPEIPRVATKPSLGSKIRRIEGKKRTSEKKASRRWKNGGRSDDAS